MTSIETLKPHPSFFGRVHNFNKMMFPFFPNVAIFLLQFIVNYLVLRTFFFAGDTEIVRLFTGWSWQMVIDLSVGSLSLVLFVYLFRCFDEVKDYPTDIINFPDRPLVSGVLSLKDIKVLQILVMTALIVLNLAVFWGRPVILGFWIVFGFTLLASRWFFFEKQIRPSLPLALVTHNPILYLYQIYILSFFYTAGVETSSLFWAAVLFLVADAMPGTAWEISRKIRGIKQEDTYTTYTKVWGRYLPLVLVALFMLGSWSLSLLAFAMSGKLYWFWSYWLVPACYIAHLVSQSIQFWKNPDIAPVFRKTVESFKFSLIIVFLICLISI